MPDDHGAWEKTSLSQNATTLRKSAAPKTNICGDKCIQPINRSYELVFHRSCPIFPRHQSTVVAYHFSMVLSIISLYCHVNVAMLTFVYHCEDGMQA
jgi:hypothetical protein